MKKFVLAILALTLFTGVLFAQSRPRIWVQNDTGYTVYYLYISSNADPSWGADVLGDRVLQSGLRIEIFLPYPITAVNRYDFRMVDLDGDSYTKMNVLVREGDTVIFTFSDID